MLAKYIFLLKLTVALICLTFFNIKAYSSAIDTSVAETNQQINYSFSPIIKKTASSVVNIYAKKRVKVNNFSHFMNDPFFSQFFSNDVFNDYSKERFENSLGSGVIISADGIIVTNYHVIDNAEDISIVLDDKDYKAQLIVKDKQHDLAFLKSSELIKEKNFKFLELADSDQVEVGDIVLAIGNPYGLGKTVTSGIISGPDRTISGKMGDYFFQTDASINPGNSGGALINYRGELIGINTAIYTQSGGSQGLGFAIPSNTVKSFLKNSDLQHGKLLKPWTGMKVVDMDKVMQEALGLTMPAVIIKTLNNKSPFHEAGLRIGDIITKIDNITITNNRDFDHKIYITGVNQKIKVEYLRNKNTYDSTILLKVAPQEPKPHYTKITSKSLISGAVVANLSPALSEELEIDIENLNPLWKDYSNLVVITEIEDNSIASSFGLKSGDIIINYNDNKITSITQLKKIIDNIKNRHTLTILRQNKIIKITG